MLSCDLLDRPHAQLARSLHRPSPQELAYYPWKYAEHQRGFSGGDLKTYGAWELKPIKREEWQWMETNTSMAECKDNCSWAGICSLSGDGGLALVSADSEKKCRCMQLEVTDEACADEPMCLNECRGHGRCEDNMCLCDPGYWCAAGALAAARAPAEAARLLDRQRKSSSKGCDACCACPQGNRLFVDHGAGREAGCAPHGRARAHRAPPRASRRQPANAPARTRKGSFCQRHQLAPYLPPHTQPNDGPLRPRYYIYDLPAPFHTWHITLSGWMQDSTCVCALCDFLDARCAVAMLGGHVWRMWECPVA